MKSFLSEQAALLIPAARMLGHQHVSILSKDGRRRSRNLAGATKLSTP